MRITHSGFVTLRPLVLLMILAGCTLTGCLAPRVYFTAAIQEKMEPEEVVVGTDGTIAIKVISIYYRKRLFDEPFGHGPKIPLNQYSPRERYLVLKPESVKNRILTTSPTTEGAYRAKEITIPYDVKAVVPEKMLAPAVDRDSLPASLTSQNAKHYSLSESIPYHDGNRIVYLLFDRFDLKSERFETRWWAFPAAAPVGIVEVAGTGVLSVVALPLGVVGMAGLLIVAPFQPR